MAHHWPGNVRELENVVARAIVLAPGEIITPDVVQISSRSAGADVEWLDQVPIRDGYWPNIRKLETHLVKTALEQAQGNKAEAARILGVQRSPALRKNVGDRAQGRRKKLEQMITPAHAAFASFAGARSFSRKRAIEPSSNRTSYH